MTNGNCWYLPLPLNLDSVDSAYGKFHPGRELTAIEMENFWFAVKPVRLWIYFKDFCAFVYVSIFLGKRSSSTLFTSFTC